MIFGIKEMIMYVALMLIDYLGSDGFLNSAIITAKNNNRVIIDALMDIDFNEPEVDIQEQIKDIGGVRVYNFHECNLTTSRVKLRSCRISGTCLNFQITHQNLPLLPNERYTVGYYNLILPSKFALNELDIYGYHNSERGKSLRHQLHQDIINGGYLLTMDLKSQYGNFSFQVRGEGHFYKGNTSPSHGISAETHINEIYRHGLFISEGESRKITSILSKFFKSTMLQPNFGGIGIDLKTLLGLRD